MKKTILICIFFLLFSCNKTDNIVEYYSNNKIKLKYSLQNNVKNGKYEEFYNNGNPKMLCLYENGIMKDSSVYFYENKNGLIKSIKYLKKGNFWFQKDFFENGKIMREGKLLKDNFRIGIWNFYCSGNYKSEVIEFLNINNISYRNQTWKLNNKGDTIFGGNFYEFRKRKDTVRYNEPNRFHFSLTQRVLSNSTLYLCIAKKGNALKSDFSNQYKIPLDTIKNMSIEFKNNSVLRDRKYDVLFDFLPRRIGRDTLRGFLLEKEVVNNNDTLDFITRQVYFSIPYYVKKW
jgi:hypothetical protein